MFVISVLAFFLLSFNAHGSLEDHFLVIRIPWINKVIIIINSIYFFYLIGKDVFQSP